MTKSLHMLPGEMKVNMSISMCNTIYTLHILHLSKHQNEKSKSGMQGIDIYMCIILLNINTTHFLDSLDQIVCASSENVVLTFHTYNIMPVQ